MVMRNVVDIGGIWVRDVLPAGQTCTLRNRHGNMAPRILRHVMREITGRVGSLEQHQGPEEKINH